MMIDFSCFCGVCVVVVVGGGITFRKRKPMRQMHFILIVLIYKIINIVPLSVCSGISIVCFISKHAFLY